MTEQGKAVFDAWTQGYACAVATLIRLNTHDPEDPDINADAKELLGAGPVLEDLQEAGIDDYDLEILKPSCIKLGHTRFQRPSYQLPKAPSKPCNECPWRRDSAEGNTGPHTAEEWIDAAHSDTPIACHKTLKGEEGWQSPQVRQCKGAALFRRNVCKSPKNPTDAAHSVKPDRVTVFASNQEFLNHHEGES